MRTTITLDPDVEKLIRAGMRRTGESFKKVLNRAVREALGTTHSVPENGTFRVDARPMRVRAGIDARNLNRLVDEIAVEDFLSGVSSKQE